MTDTLRRAVNEFVEDGGSFLELERETGILRQSLMKFARSETSLILSAGDKLADYFGMELKPTAKRKGK